MSRLNYLYERLRAASRTFTSPDGTFKKYWRLYGGWPRLLESPYLYLAIILTVICYPLWSRMDNNEYTWVQIAIDIIPSVLGFSLGGMAILLAFSNETFLEGIREGGRPDSLFMDAVVMFFHFILLQVIALLTSFITAAYSCIIISMMGFFLMTYAAMAAVAVAAALFEMSALFNISGNQNSSTNTKDKE